MVLFVSVKTQFTVIVAVVAGAVRLFDCLTVRVGHGLICVSKNIVHCDSSSSSRRSRLFDCSTVWLFDCSTVRPFNRSTVRLFDLDMVLFVSVLFLSLSQLCTLCATQIFTLGNQNYLVSPVPRITKPPIHSTKGLGMLYQNVQTTTFSI